MQIWGVHLRTPPLSYSLRSAGLGVTCCQASAEAEDREFKPRPCYRAKPLSLGRRDKKELRSWRPDSELTLACPSLPPTVGSLQSPGAAELPAHLGQGGGRAAAEPEAPLCSLQAEAGGSPGRGLEARRLRPGPPAGKAQPGPPKSRAAPLLRELLWCPPRRAGGPLFSLQTQFPQLGHTASSCASRTGPRDSASLFCSGMAMLPPASCEPVVLRRIPDCLEA